MVVPLAVPTTSVAGGSRVVKNEPVRSVSARLLSLDRSGKLKSPVSADPVGKQTGPVNSQSRLATPPKKDKISREAPIRDNNQRAVAQEAVRSPLRCVTKPARKTAISEQDQLYLARRFHSRYALGCFASRPAEAIDSSSSSVRNHENIALINTSPTDSKKPSQKSIRRWDQSCLDRIEVPGITPPSYSTSYPPGPETPQYVIENIFAKERTPEENMKIRMVYHYNDRVQFSRVINEDTLQFNSHFESGNLQSAQRVFSEGGTLWSQEVSLPLTLKPKLPWRYAYLSISMISIPFRTRIRPVTSSGTTSA